MRNSVTRYLLHVVAATVGTMMLAAIVVRVLFVCWNLINPSVTSWSVYSLLFKRYFPVQIFCGLAAGYLNGRHFRDRSATWVWVIPAIRVVFAVATWRSTSILEDHTRAVLDHFFLENCQPPLWTRSCVDQSLITVPLYSSIAYSIGTLIARHFGEETPASDDNASAE
jgi:hypothetical protein